MASNTVTIAGVTFPNVPAVDLAVSGGGTARYTDVSDTTATASDVASGKVFYKADGTQDTGTASGGTPTLTTVSSSYSAVGAKIIYTDENGDAQTYNCGDPGGPLFSATCPSGSLITVVSGLGSTTTISNTTSYYSTVKPSGSIRYVGIFQVN